MIGRKWVCVLAVLAMSLAATPGNADPSSVFAQVGPAATEIEKPVTDQGHEASAGVAAPPRATYQVLPADNDKPLSNEDSEFVLKSANGFSKFGGNFLVKAGIGNLPSVEMSDVDRERAGKLGRVQSFSISQDLDGDGDQETLSVLFKQSGYALTLSSRGVAAQLSSCFDGDIPTNVEVALKDINGDRKPEVWIAYETRETAGWGKFCILEYKGVSDLAARQRVAPDAVDLGFDAFRTLLRGESGSAVAVADDNTIKACGGSDCQSSSTYSFDGTKFRQVDISGQKPSGAAALPFADERERASELYATMTRSGGPLLTSHGWSLLTKGDSVAVSGRIGDRTDFAYRCSGNSVGGIAHESLELRDTPEPNAMAGAEVEIEPIFSYGESRAAAPILLDGRSCGPVSISTAEDGRLSIRSAGDAGSACFEGLARTRIVTLPLLHRNSLVRVRLEGSGQMLSQARALCGGKVTSISAVQPLDDRATLLERPTGDAGALNARARQFVQDYMKRTEGDIEEVLAYVLGNFDSEIRYYGKSLPLLQVLKEKRLYLLRWPHRRYALKPDTMKIDCDQQRASCLMSGEVDFEVRDPKTKRSSSGAATYELRVVFSQGGPKVIEENGRMLPN